MWSWVEVGGFPAWPEEEAKGLLAEASLLVPHSPFLSLPSNWYWVSLCSLAFYLDFLSLFFQGLWSLQQASQLWEEARKLEERAQQLETEGWGKMKEAVAGSEAEGLYGLLRGVTSYSHPVPSQPPIKKPCFGPSTTISQPPPQESTGPKVSEPAGQATVPASSAAPPAPEEAIPAHMQPLRIQVGGIKRVYKCWVEDCKEGHQPHGPLSVYTSGRYT